MHSIEFRAMNCQMAAMIDAHSRQAEEALAQVPRWFADWEQCLSRFIADSELNRINSINAKDTRDWTGVSDVMWDVLRAADAASCWSDGLVTPLVGAAMCAAGYDRSFELMQTQLAIAGAALYDIDLRALELNATNQAVRLPPAAQLDLGGFAKSWAAEQAVASLQQFGPALVDAGGDIAASSRANDEAWPIGIAHPLDAETTTSWVVNLKQGGIATSGRDYRRWRAAGEWQHHIIDARTGRPAVTDVLTATVIAPDAMMAEVAAKVALILGSADGLRWIEAHDDLAALLILEDGEALPSIRLEEYLWQ